MNNEIYLVGSYHGFRDNIILNLSKDYKIRDPRNHRQSSVAKLVIDDLGAAENSNITFAIFPKGKSPGTMTYTEVGVALSHGNNVVVADENEDPDPVLKELSDYHFDDMNKAVKFFNSNPSFKMPDRDVESKYPAGYSGKVICEDILIAGTITRRLENIVNKIKRNTTKNIEIVTNPIKQFNELKNYDLLCVNFPEDVTWQKSACLFMGGAYARDISIVLCDEHNWMYPPLTGVARRHCRDVEGFFEYIREVDDLNISKEAVNMYEFFKRGMKQ